VPKTTKLEMRLIPMYTQSINANRIPAKNTNKMPHTIYAA